MVPKRYFNQTSTSQQDFVKIYDFNEYYAKRREKPEISLPFNMDQLKALVADFLRT